MRKPGRAAKISAVVEQPTNIPVVSNLNEGRIDSPYQAAWANLKQIRLRDNNYRMTNNTGRSSAHRVIWTLLYATVQMLGVTFLSLLMSRIPHLHHSLITAPFFGLVPGLIMGLLAAHIPLSFRGSSLCSLAASRPDCPPGTLALLAQNPAANVRLHVAERADCPPEALALLAGDVDVGVSRTALANPNCPEHIRLIAVLAY